jgi:peptide/nickel transport system substrate-binding protein
MAVRSTTSSRVTRRSLLAGMSAAGAAAWLAACGGSQPSGSGSGASSSGSGSPAAGATTAGARFQGPGAPNAPLPKDIDKLNLEEMRTLYAGSRFKELPGQEKGPTAGGVLRFRSRAPVTWDPTSPAGSLMASYLFANNQLIQFKINDWVKNPNFMEVEPVLAEAMPEQPDPQTFVFKLRKGVKFQNVPPVNGREFTADDVVYCVEAYRRAPAQGPTFAELDRVEKIDNYTVAFKMQRPAAYFLGTFVVPFHWIFSREQHQAPDGLAKMPLGTGAFLFESAENLAGYKFRKNPDYFRKDERTGKQLPYLDRLETTWIPNPAQEYASFRAGELDHVYPQDFQSWVALMRSNPESVTQVTTPPPSFQPFIVMRNDREPFRDIRVRRALSMLIDRDAIAQSLAGGMAGWGYGQDWTYFGQEWPWTPDQLGQWMKYDQRQARQLLDAAGVREPTFDFLLTSFSGFNFDVWNAVAAMWQAGGIKTTIDAPQDPAKWQSQFYGGSYQALVGTGLIGPGWDPDAFAYHALFSKSPRNYYKVDDPRVDDMVVRQRQTMNKEERQKILRELMNYDLEQVTRLWTITPYKINLRKPYMYSLVDTEAAWNPLGWGSLGVDMAWRAPA